MPLTDLDRALTEVLIDHDLALQRRRTLRTKLSWPDESDIFKETRRRLHAVFAGEPLPRAEWATTYPDANARVPMAPKNPRWIAPALVLSVAFIFCLVILS